MTRYGKLYNGFVTYAPTNKDNISNYNSDPVRMKADGWYVVVDTQMTCGTDETLTQCYTQEGDKIVQGWIVSKRPQHEHRPQI